MQNRHTKDMFEVIKKQLLHFHQNVGQILTEVQENL